MSTMKKTKFTCAVAGLALAGLALTGCSAAGDGQDGTAPGITDGSYVLAPEDGGLFTLTVTGADVEITHATCATGATSTGGTGTETAAPVESDVDPRETAFGELTETGEGDARSIRVNWVEGGAFTEEPTHQMEALSDGQIVRVGEQNFFSADGDQGSALQEQFDTDCADGAGTEPEPGETEGTEDTEGTSGPAVDVEAESGTTYVYARGGVVPSMERWVVAEDGGTVTFDRLTCLGTTKDEVSGKLEGQRVMWDGENPQPGTASEWTTLEPITPEELTIVGSGEVATSDVDAETDRFVDLCAATGEDVGNFVLP